MQGANRGRALLGLTAAQGSSRKLGLSAAVAQVVDGSGEGDGGSGRKGTAGAARRGGEKKDEGEWSLPSSL